MRLLQTAQSVAGGRSLRPPPELPDRFSKSAAQKYAQVNTQRSSRLLTVDCQFARDGRA